MSASDLISSNLRRMDECLKLLSLVAVKQQLGLDLDVSKITGFMERLEVVVSDELWKEHDAY